MKASDLIQLLEYSKAFNKPVEKIEKKERKRSTPKKDVRELLDQLSASDLLNLLAEKEREHSIISGFLKDKEKLNKKEEKKEDKKESSANLAFYLVLLFPVIAPLYVYIVKMMLHL